MKIRLNVFIYLDSDDKIIATTEKPKVQVGEFASLKVVEVNSIGVFLIVTCRLNRRRVVRRRGVSLLLLIYWSLSYWSD